MRVMSVRITSVVDDKVHVVESKAIQEYHDTLYVMKLVRDANRKMDDYLNKVEKEKTESP